MEIGDPPLLLDRLAVLVQVALPEIGDVALEDVEDQHQGGRNVGDAVGAPGDVEGIEEPGRVVELAEQDLVGSE